MEKRSTLLSTKIEVNDGKITKEYALKTIKPEYKEQVSKLILKYYEKLKENNIPVPNLIESNGLSFTSDYKGENIIDSTNDIEEFYNFNEKIFDSIFDIIKLAIEKNICIDPHIKNFTIDNEEVYYVDVFPPHGEEYWKILLDSNEGREYEVSETLDLFKPNMLAHHFLADFHGTFNNMKLVEKLAKKMVEKNLIKSFDINTFNKILMLEAEVKGIFKDRYDNVS